MLPRIVVDGRQVMSLSLSIYLTNTHYPNYTHPYIYIAFANGYIIMAIIEDADSAPSQPTESFSRSDHLHPFAASSNASTTLEDRSTGPNNIINAIINRRNMAIGGGKLGKSTRGWHKLPNNILQYVPLEMSSQVASADGL
jgi:hypothetical protein